MIEDPMLVFGVLMAILSLVFLSQRVGPARPIYRYLPPVFWLYVLPMILSSAGILPSASPTYQAMIFLMLPAALFLLTVGMDAGALIRLGRPAVLGLLTGTFGVFAGFVLAFLIFRSTLPQEAWRGLATLSGSWIGGSANFVAVQQALSTPSNMLGALLLVDAVVAYGWLAIILAASRFQSSADRWFRADTAALDSVEQRLLGVPSRERRPGPESLLLVASLALLFAVLARGLAAVLPTAGENGIVGPGSWAVIGIVSLGLLLSITPARRLNEHGSSEVGYLMLYGMLPAVGAQADVSSASSALIFMAVGVLVLAVHVATMILVGRFLRLPMFFFAVGSMANLGGVASAPIVAAAYKPSLAAVGAVMGVAGNVLGIYVPLLLAYVLAWMAL